MNDQWNSPGLLSGYRALDLADEKGLLCGKILGDLGADVIKIERPGGDPARDIGPFYKGIPDPEKSLFWFFTNTSKRGVTLNIETSDGREIFKRLVTTADFVIESFDPGYMDGLGLGYREIEKVNPGVIMTSITPFGQTGPYAHYKATDIVLWGLGGMQYTCGDPDRPPIRVSVPQAYFHGGAQGALGSMVAFYFRQTMGEGQHVDVSIQDALPLTLQDALSYWDMNRFNITRAGAVLRRPRPQGDLLYGLVWPCKDGYVSWKHSLAGGAFAGHVTSTKNMLEMANRQGLAGDLMDYDWTRFNTDTVEQEVVDHQAGIFGRFFLSRTKAQLMQEAVERAYILGPMNDVRDLLESPQLATRDYWTPVEHPELGEVITYPGAPVKTSELPCRIWRRAPLIGEHNEEVYIGEIGLSREELSTLKAQGVI